VIHVPRSGGFEILFHRPDGCSESPQDEEVAMALRTIRLAAAVVLGLLVLAPATATADTPSGSGSVGWAHGFSQHQPIQIDAIASCSVGGVASASSSGAEARGFVSFGSGRSSCSTQADGTAKVEVSGRRFTMEGLRAYGGPVIKVANFSAICTTAENGSRSTVKLAGLTGVRLPPTVPANHTVTIPGASPSDPPVARIIFNETVVPSPPDGSMTVNLMRIQLFPEGVALAHGEVVVGSVHCSPRG
jgi:hypothetical protein